MAIVGLCFGPMLHYWYKGLERVLPGRTLKDVFKKIGLEQSFAAPFYIFLFFMGKRNNNSSSFGFTQLAEFRYATNKHKLELEILIPVNR